MTIDQPSHAVDINRPPSANVDPPSPFNFTPGERREYEAATLRFTTAAHIENYLDHAGMQAKDLAQRIRKSRSWVSKLLSGRQNATLDTLAEVALALGAKWTMDLVAANRRGTPAENDVPPPAWAIQQASTATVSVSMSQAWFGFGGLVPSPFEVFTFTSKLKVQFLQSAQADIHVIPDPQWSDFAAMSNAIRLIGSPEQTVKYLPLPSSEVITEIESE